MTNNINNSCSIPHLDIQIFNSLQLNFNSNAVQFRDQIMRIICPFYSCYAYLLILLVKVMMGERENDSTNSLDRRRTMIAGRMDLLA
jgi:hypothetical protein